VQYIVIVTRCDEYFSMGDLDASSFYGPYRSREAAERDADKINNYDAGDAGIIHSTVIPLETLRVLEIKNHPETLG